MEHSVALVSFGDGEARTPDQVLFLRMPSFIPSAARDFIRVLFPSPSFPFRPRVQGTCLSFPDKFYFILIRLWLLWLIFYHIQNWIKESEVK